MLLKGVMNASWPRTDLTETPCDVFSQDRRSLSWKQLVTPLEILTSDLSPPYSLFLVDLRPISLVKLNAEEAKQTF